MNTYEDEEISELEESEPDSVHYDYSIDHSPEDMAIAIDIIAAGISSMTGEYVWKKVLISRINKEDEWA